MLHFIPKEEFSMKNIYLSNAFSLQMLATIPAVPIIENVSPEEISQADFVSVIGHPDTANVLSNILGKEVKFNRASLTLAEGDILYVAQLTGGRLPEGCTILPEGFKFSFVKIRVLYENSLCVGEKGGVCDFITGCPCNCVHIG